MSHLRDAVVNDRTPPKRFVQLQGVMDFVHDDRERTAPETRRTAPETRTATKKLKAGADQSDSEFPPPAWTSAPGDRSDCFGELVEIEISSQDEDEPPPSKSAYYTADLERTIFKSHARPDPIFGHHTGEESSSTIGPASHDTGEAT